MPEGSKIDFYHFSGHHDLSHLPYLRNYFTFSIQAELTSPISLAFRERALGDFASQMHAPQRGWA